MKENDCWVINYFKNTLINKENIFLVIYKWPSLQKMNNRNYKSINKVVGDVRCVTSITINTKEK